MKRIILLSVTVILSTIIHSCGDAGSGGQSLLPNLSGSSGEVLVVLDKARWEGRLGDKIRQVLASPVPRLPQAEPYFDLINTGGNDFSKLYQTHRNVLFVETGVDREKQVTFMEDTYSSQQLMINLQARNDEEIMELLDEEGQAIVNKLNIAERDRWISVYKKSLNSMIFNKLRDEHKMTLHVPYNFSLDVEENGFLWLSYETPTTTQSILIYYFDHEGKNYFNKDSIMRIRDSMTRQKVEGPASGSYMAIEDMVPVNYSLFRFRDRNYAEMRGLWTLEKGFMGGPFINVVTKDEVNERFVMLDGFVYAPNEEKRELMRQVEAIIYTIGFPDDSEVIVTPGN